VDENASPKQIDIRLSEEGKQPIDLKGIYRFKKISGKVILEYCFAQQSEVVTDQTPTEFSVPTGSGRALIRLEQKSNDESEWARLTQFEFGLVLDEEQMKGKAFIEFLFEEKDLFVPIVDIHKEPVALLDSYFDSTVEDWPPMDRFDFQVGD